MLNGILPASWQGYTHAALRIVSGLLFLEHGSAKLFSIPNMDEMLKSMPSAMLTGTGLADFLGGLLIVIGLYTRSVAFVLSGYMAVAYFIVHLPMGFFPILNFGEPALLYAFIFLWLATAGAGPISIDATRKA